MKKTTIAFLIFYFGCIYRLQKNKIKQAVKLNLYVIRKDWNWLREQAGDIRKKITWGVLKNAFWKLYKKIDTGNPTWLSILPRLGITFHIKQPIISVMKNRKRHRHLREFVPAYFALGSNSIMISTWKIPEDSDTILEMRKIFKLLQENNWVKITKVETIDNSSLFSDKPDISFDTKFKHKEYGQIDVWIYLDSKCDIEYKEVVKKEPVMAGICAKVIKELNQN